MIKGVSKLVGKMISLDDPSYRSFLELPKTETVSRLLLLVVGLGYGAISIASQASYISSFDSALLQNFLVPAIFILFGILTAFITKVGMAALLWAGSKALGGTAKYRAVSLVTPVALLPGLLGAPYLAGLGGGSVWVNLFLVAGIIWMYLVGVKIVQVVQGFSATKAYLSAGMAFLFLASIYYLVIPAS
ncbi:hypothetical protein BBI15_08780 [Planococcus plakortidis]|uniref:Yip1 domain-containing protein n=1 Tax=Planococcus plakortidis TaxID=1038856 RepID=A0A1C7E8K4_9BACL|nr:hypothetical protein BBI15_08780 [Planococcus plakortidis]